MTQDSFVQERPTLYHLSTGDAWADIREHGLFCTADILKQCGITTEQKRSAVYRERRKSNKAFAIPGKCAIVVRDQKPLCWEGLRKAVEPGLTPLQWIDALNSRTFFWTYPKHMNRLRTSQA